MNAMKIELIPVPVSDVDLSKAFYVDKVGFHLDHDVNSSEMRVVQLTPPGSACSILIGTGLGEISEMEPGSVKGLHLVVEDIVAVRDKLIEKDIDVAEIINYEGRIRFASFSDLDGNTWILQEMKH